jgi:hypothetical protein
MLLEPGWREDDLKRLKDDMHVNYLRVTLRGNNDEELGKDVLINEIFARPSVRASQRRDGVAHSEAHDGGPEGFYAANLHASERDRSASRAGIRRSFVERVKKGLCQAARGKAGAAEAARAEDGRRPPSMSS